LAERRFHPLVYVSWVDLQDCYIGSYGQEDWESKADVTLANGIWRTQFFVSLAGESEWVRNVRAAGGNAVLISRKRYPIRLVEIAAELRAPVMLAYVQRRAFTHSGAQTARHFFGLGANPTLTEMQALAEKYVVLEILPRDLQG
jgi:hypothetical protein